MLGSKLVQKFAQDNYITVCTCAHFLNFFANRIKLVKPITKIHIKKIHKALSKLEVFFYWPLCRQRLCVAFPLIIFGVRTDVKSDVISNNPTMNDSDLQILVDSWSSLSVAAKAGIMGIVKAMR